MNRITMRGASLLMVAVLSSDGNRCSTPGPILEHGLHKRMARFLEAGFAAISLHVPGRA